MLKFDRKGRLAETEYRIECEAKHAALFTTGNGYMGVRGSFEEFGSLRIQGAYVRGLIDEIIEVMEPFPDNEYMKKWYLDEEKLKGFEKQDSCINVADLVFARIEVNGVTFYPWEGRILRWERTLDPADAVLRRTVEWDNGRGELTRFEFERFASFEDQHLYCQRIAVTPLNHSVPVRVLTGIDTRVKTGGQFRTQPTRAENTGARQIVAEEIGDRYGFRCELEAFSTLTTGPLEPAETEKGILAGAAEFIGPAVLEKQVVLCCSRDPGAEDPQFCSRLAEKHRRRSYAELYAAHRQAYDAYFRRFDIRIEGDHEADSALRFANYHTAISAPLHDSVHGISAKALTGERYNQFVWWDCEIYQLPIFIHTAPQTARNALLYRYRLLEQSRRQAREQGLSGAKFAFCSAVTGEEKVWSYARHPFLQIHIDADIGFGILSYCRVTGDWAFMDEYGMEMLIEILRYYLSRSTLRGGRYEILGVTGTDEHHPYVDNDAYTNYLVRHVFDSALELLKEDGYKRARERTQLRGEELAAFADYAERLYLPMEPSGMIPQFDGYFSLDRGLTETGGSAATSFQMKKSALYHRSQVIKQPDVMLLYTYLNLSMPQEGYAGNWDYYERQCETSSSLSFPVHAICSADHGRMLSFYQYFMQTVRMDIDDIHACAWQGVHAGCAAGGWYSVFRGIFGFVCREDALYAAPKRYPWWKKVEMRFLYQGAEVLAQWDGKTLSVRSDSQITLVCGGTRLTGKRFRLNIS